MATALIELLKDAGIPSHYAGLWFLDCTFDHGVLWVPTRQDGQCLARLFGVQLRAVYPTIKIQVSIKQRPEDTAQPPSYLNAAGRKAWKAERPTQQKLSEDA